jgi:hypothetical protein
MYGRGPGHLDSKLPKLQQRDPERLRTSSNVEPAVRSLLECMRSTAPELSASLKAWHALAAETGAVHCANDAQAQAREGFGRERPKQQSAAGTFTTWKTRI